MSEDLPPLPASDDPFEILGVPPESDDRALRRAYARLIKRYRPDRHPDEFRRIQTAYETALDFSRFREAWGGGDENADDVTPDPVPGFAVDAMASEDSAPAEPPVPETPVGEAWTVFENEGPEAAMDRIRELLRAHPEDLELHAAKAALLIRLERVTDEVVAEVAALLVRRPEFLAYLEGEGAMELLDRAVLDPRLEARLLIRGAPGYLVMRALSERCQHYLMEGRWPELVQEFSDTAVLRAIDEEPIIGAALLRAACALAWISPPEGRRLYDLAARESVPAEGSLEDRYLERARLEPTWRRWHEAHPEMAPLSRLLTLEDTVDHASFLALLAEVGACLRADPRRYLEGVAALDDADEALSVLYLGALEPRISEPGDEADEETVTQARGQRLVGFLRDTDWAIEHDFFGDIVFKSIGVVGVLAIGCFVRLGSLARIPFIDAWGPWIGGVLLLIAVGLFFFGARFQDARLYEKHVRPRALRLTLDTGVTPQEIVEGMHEYRKSLESVGRFQMETAQDSPLHLVARTVTLLDEAETETA